MHIWISIDSVLGEPCIASMHSSSRQGPDERGIWWLTDVDLQLSVVVGAAACCPAAQSPGRPAGDSYAAQLADDACITWKRRRCLHFSAASARVVFLYHMRTLVSSI